MDRAFDIGCSFGVMQGRLSVQTTRGYQSFPWESWSEEFVLARERGLEHIEWVLDSWMVDENPILTSVDDVTSVVRRTDVQVISVCADYLMDRPLDADAPDSWTTLRRLVSAMHDLGAQWLVIPCVDQSSLRDPSALTRFRAACEPLQQLLLGTGVRVSLEADLGPAEFASLLADTDPAVFGVNYDIGNSAYLGYSHAEEFAEYGDRVSLVHVKDRLLGGPSVPLGQGAADLPGVFGLLRSMGFNGPVTMQAFRDARGLDVLDAQLLGLQADLVHGA